MRQWYEKPAQGQVFPDVFQSKKCKLYMHAHASWGGKSAIFFFSRAATEANYCDRKRKAQNEIIMNSRRAGEMWIGHQKRNYLKTVFKSREEDKGEKDLRIAWKSFCSDCSRRLLFLGCGGRPVWNGPSDESMCREAVSRLGTWLAGKIFGVEKMNSTGREIQIVCLD